MISKRKTLIGYAATALVFLIGWTVPDGIQVADGTEASDGTIKRIENSWVMGTGLVEKTVALEEGRFFLKSFVDKTTGAELVGANSGEFFTTLTDPAKPLTGLSGGWKLVDSETRTLKQGERQLSLTLERENLQVTKHYLVFPLTSVIREWVVFKNVGETPLTISDPGFLDFRVRPGDPADIDFLWMSGGGSVPGSWQLKTEQLPLDQSREFDNYDPFPFPEDIMDHVAGNGVRAKILLNGRQVWPEEGWALSPFSGVSVKIDFQIDVEVGDKLVFVLNGNGNTKQDRTVYPPTIYYPDGTEYLSWGYFSGEQGKNGWYYQAMQDGQLKDMFYHPGPEKNGDYRTGIWTLDKDDPKALPNIEWNWASPGKNADSARVWKAETAGRVRVKCQFCNDQNWAGNPDYGPKGSSDSYAPWYAIYNRKNAAGLYIGWDYFGHWKSQFTQSEDGQVPCSIQSEEFQEGTCSGRVVGDTEGVCGTLSRRP